MVEGLRWGWEGDINGRYDIHVTGLAEFGQLGNLLCDIITILRENLDLYYLHGKYLGKKSLTINATSPVTSFRCNTLWKWGNIKDSAIRPKNDCCTDEESSVMFVVKQGLASFGNIRCSATSLYAILSTKGGVGWTGVGNRNAGAAPFYCQRVPCNLSHNLDCTRYIQIIL